MHRASTPSLIALTALAISAAALGGCASPRPPSLDTAASEALADVDLATLTAPAASLRHPVLKPVALDPGQPLTADAVAVLAVINNPDLKAARARARIADAQVITAGLLPDPTVGLSGDFRQSGPDTGNGWAAQIAYELTALRDHGLLVKVAKAAQRQVRLDLAWQEWTTAEQAKILAGRVLALARIADLAERTRAETVAAGRQVGEAAERGDAKADDLNARLTAQLDAVDKATQAARDAAAARLDLNALLGLQPQTVLSIAATSPDRRTRNADALFTLARTRRLDLLALRAGYDSQSVVLRKAVRDRFPSFALSLSRTTDTANNQTLGPSINLTLPLWNRNRGPIAEATATRDALRADYAARVFATRSDITALVDSLARTETQRDAAALAVRALLSSADASDAASGRGDLSITQAQGVRQTARDRLVALIALDQSILEQTVALELATGGPLP